MVDWRRVAPGLIAVLLVPDAAQAAQATRAGGTIVVDGAALPASATLDGRFDCGFTMVALGLGEQGRVVSLRELVLGGTSQPAAAKQRVGEALRGWSRVTGMSARCNPQSRRVTLLLTGQASKAVDGAEGVDAGLEIAFAGKTLAAVRSFPLD